MFLKMIDIYGTSYNFTLFKEPFYKTSGGGFFTLLTIICFALSFIFFSQDFYLRQNPRFIKEQITEASYPMYNITQENNIFAAFGIEDSIGNLLKLDDYFNITFLLNVSVRQDAKTYGAIQTNLPSLDCSMLNYSKMRIF